MIRISRIKISNFRSIKHVELDLPQVCALVGPNNAGKSNLLHAIQKVLGREYVSVSAFTEDDVYGRDPTGIACIQVSFNPPLSFVKFKGATPVSIPTLAFEYTRYKTGERTGERRLDQKCLDAAGKTPLVLAKAPRAGEKHQYEPVIGIPSEVREQVPIIYIGTNRSLREQLPSARYSMLRQLLEDIDRDLHDPRQTIRIKQADGSEVDIPRAHQFQTLMGRAMALLRTKEFEKLERSLKENALRQLGFDPTTDAEKLDFFFAPFDSMDFYKSLDLQVREGDFTISAVELGEGMQNALVLSMLQAFEARRKQGAIFLIEEPEMFLHPQMQRSLFKTLREIGMTNQVIFTTHSPHFVSVPDYDEVVLIRKDDKTGTQARCSDLPTNKARREKLRKELDPERNELFFASRLLLVEGDTEKLALPEYAQNLGLDLDRAGATIVEVGGKRNLPEFIQIARSFNISVGILYDEDSSDFENDRDSERVFNSSLDSFKRDNPAVKVWRIKGNYESCLRETIGEEQYQTFCQKIGKCGKPTKARLIATERDLQIPQILEEVLKWLADKAVTKEPPEEADEDMPF